jgi:hypothetical protein
MFTHMLRVRFNSDCRRIVDHQLEVMSLVPVTAARSTGPAHPKQRRRPRVPGDGRSPATSGPAVRLAACAIARGCTGRCAWRRRRDHPGRAAASRLGPGRGETTRPGLRRAAAFWPAGPAGGTRHSTRGEPGDGRDQAARRAGRAGHGPGGGRRRAARASRGPVPVPRPGGPRRRGHPGAVRPGLPDRRRSAVRRPPAPRPPGAGRDPLACARARARNQIFVRSSRCQLFFRQ